jgi:hypothetical protein
MLKLYVSRVSVNHITEGNSSYYPCFTNIPEFATVECTYEPIITYKNYVKTISYKKTAIVTFYYRWPNYCPISRRKKLYDIDNTGIFYSPKLGKIAKLEIPVNNNIKKYIDKIKKYTRKITITHTTNSEFQRIYGPSVISDFLLAYSPEILEYIKCDNMI